DQLSGSWLKSGRRCGQFQNRAVVSHLGTQRATPVYLPAFASSQPPGPASAERAAQTRHHLFSGSQFLSSHFSEVLVAQDFLLAVGRNDSGQGKIRRSPGWRCFAGWTRARRQQKLQATALFIAGYRKIEHIPIVSGSPPEQVESLIE